MSTLFEEVESLVKRLEYYPYMEAVKFHWCKNDDEFRWVDCYGDIYSAEYNQGVLSREGCVIVNIDNGCGDTVTMVFLKEMELSEDEFYEKY